MDLSLKQRLLGAAVLIALAVIIVPMILSGSAPHNADEMQVSSLAIPPAPDREFRNRVLNVEPARPDAVPDAPVAETIATVDTGAASAPPAPSPSPPSSPSPSQPPSASAPVVVAVAKPPASPAPPPVREAPAAKPDPGQAASGRFYVNLGVYATASNAQDLVAALKKDGFAASAEASEVQGKPARRVQVGPFATRAAAEASRLRIRQLHPKVPGSVVALADDAKADAPATAIAPARAGAWAVQLGALRTAEDANRLRDRVKAAGFVAFVDKVSANGTTLWRVRAGPEVDRAAAEKLRNGIKDKLKLDGMIVTQQ